MLEKMHWQGAIKPLARLPEASKNRCWASGFEEQLPDWANGFFYDCFNRG
jgi:hypothetical protein